MLRKFIKGLAFGSVVGGALGLLYAPRSGNDSRQKLINDVDEATDLTYELSDSLKNLKLSVATLKTTAGEILPDFKEETKKSIETFQFQAGPRITEITKQVEKINQKIDPSKSSKHSE